VDEIMPDTDRGFFDTLEPFVKNRQSVRDIEEGIRLLLSKDFMNSVIYFCSLLVIKCATTIE
jgi:hypothetical protein